MSSSEFDIIPTPNQAAPMTRREARAREEAARLAPAVASPAVASPTVASHAVESHAVAPPAASSRMPVYVRTPVYVAPRPPQKKRSAGPSRLLSLGAMLFAAALLVGTTVPANAFLADATAIGPASQLKKLPGQTLAVSQDAQMASASRDTFDVISYADQLRLKYGNVSYSFTATTGAIRWPFPYPVPITDGFGDRPAGTSGSSHHNGVDFVPGSGTPIYAVADGVVQLHQEDFGGYGNHVILTHEIDGLKFDSVYAHMQSGSSPLVTGAPIKAGDFVGLVGDTGDSYGAHLHFEIRLSKLPVDPFAWLTENAKN